MPTAPKPPLTTLLWDNDGVLVDTEALYFEATRGVLAEVGVTLSEAQYRELFLVDNRGAWFLAEAAGVPKHELPRLVSLRNQRYEDLLRSRDSLMPGIVDVLAALAPHFRMAIVTSSRRTHFDAIHRERALLPYFELVLAREDYAESKPSPEPYLLALERLQVRTDECLVIEDSERGLQAALAAGIRCWALPSGLTRSFTFVGAERRLDSLSALQTALLAL